MSSECIFCKIARGEIPTETLLETDHFLAFQDINPQAPVHVLIIPKKHIPTLNELTEQHASIASGMLQLARDVAAKTGIAESGYRTIINTNRGAGQEIFHLHLHVLGGRPLEKMG